MHKRLDELCMNDTYHYLFYILRHILNYCNCSLLKKGFIINALAMIINNMIRPYRKKYLFYIGCIERLIYDINEKYDFYLFQDDKNKFAYETFLNSFIREEYNIFYPSIVSNLDE